MDDVLTLLVHLGYLAYDAETKTVHIPNEEIRQEFVRAVRNSRHAEVANLLVGVSYDEKTKRHECVIEKHGK